VLSKRCFFAPLVGRITAGQPVLAEENLEGYFPLPAEIAPGGSCFVLRVEGDSMIGAGIFDGDYVIVRQQQTAENGDIVAALLGDEATVKRFYRENGTIRLQPENENYEPIISREVQILGKVVGLFRRF
jgi:repressor LexA